MVRILKLKNIFARRVMPLFLAAALVVGLLTTTAVRANSYTAELTASKSSVTVGGDVTVSLAISGGGYASVQAQIDYDADVFTYKGTSVAGSGEFIDATDNSSAGTVLLTRYGAAKTDGDTVAALIFEASGTGSAKFGASDVYVSESGGGAEEYSAAEVQTVSVTVTQPSTDGSSPLDDEWAEADLVIYTADELFAFAQSVNGGNSYSGKVVRLGADIDLADALWTPIGVFGYSDGLPFSGDFDGDGYTVKGLNITGGGASESTGFFSYVTDAVIRNLSIDGAINMSASVSASCGAIVGHAGGFVRISNCKNYADITVGGANNVTVGGIAGDAGYLWYGTSIAANAGIFNCENFGNITTNTRVNHLGGIAGDAYRVLDSANHGNIKMNYPGTDGAGLNAGGYVGGIVGYGTTYIQIERCYNDGDIYGYTYYLGGILGVTGNADAEAHINNCYNLADITNLGQGLGTKGSTPPAVAGIVAAVSANPANSGKAEVLYNYNSGALYINAENQLRGDIAAMVAVASVVNPALNNIEAAKTSPAYTVVDGIPVLNWQVAAPQVYAVTFAGTASVVGQATGADGGYRLAVGTYTYSGDNGATGAFNVVSGDKRIALSADVAFSNLADQSAVVALSRGDVVIGASSPGVYTGLPNGVYGYAITIDGEEKDRGDLLVAGVDRVIAVRSLEDRVAVVFDVVPETANVAVTAADGTPAARKGGVGNTFLLYVGQGYTYTVSAANYDSKTGNVDSTAGTVSVALVRQTIRVTFNVTPSYATVALFDSDNNPVAPIESGGKTYALAAGLEYSYAVTAPDHLSKTGSFTANSQTVSETLTAASGFTADTSWYSENETGFVLRSAGELAGLAELVNDGVDFKGKTVELGNSINLGNAQWIPIGGRDKPFAGTFDGNDHEITGLNISTKNNVSGLFGLATGALRDFSVKGAIVGGEYVGGVAAFASGEITGVTNYVNIVSHGNYVGGIVGDAAGGIRIDNCHNHGTIENTTEEKSSGKLGGIIGRVDNGLGGPNSEPGAIGSGSITNCSNTADIDGYQYVGGIIGGQFGNIDVQYCYNSGNLTGRSFGKVYLGGIAGKSEGGTIDSCYNRGSLYDAHVGEGHIRAIGGIAGNEENRTEGTKAITRCYTTGEITFNYSNMGSSGIHEVGNISGGNNASGYNTMVYEACFYLEGRIPAADPGHKAYVYWEETFKIDPLVFDTKYITKATEDELKGTIILSALGAGFAEDTNTINEGYPILAWQTGSTAPIEVKSPVAEPIVLGGTEASSAATDVPSASRGETVTIAVNPEAGKKVYTVTVTDAAGTGVSVTGSGSNTYTFEMPGRSVGITVLLENIGPYGAPHTLALPEGLDAIWTLDVESSGKSGGQNLAGSSVFVTVRKDPGARTANHDGITLTPETEITELIEGSGKYSFTMPDADAALTLKERYTPIDVREQIGKDGKPKIKLTYTREKAIELASENMYYSGWSSETDPLLGRADLALPLKDLLKQAGIAFEAGDTLALDCIDSLHEEYSYDELMGAQRWYYPNIFTGSAEGRTAFDPIFVLKGYAATRSSGEDITAATCDMLNTYRFIYGQTEGDFANHTKSVDKQPKHVISITVVKPEPPSAPGNEDSGQKGTGNIGARVWDGKSIDLTWFTPDATQYHISTPAQFAGLAALVNGLYNPDIDTIEGNADYIQAKRVNGGVDPDSQNDSTETYHYGKYDFADKIIYLDADIDMSGGNYMPIGGQYLMTANDSSTKISSSFNGTLDGQGHRVTVKCDRWAFRYGDGQSVGLIGRLGAHQNDSADMRADNPTVRNVMVYGTIYANRSVGGIVGKIGVTGSGATVENCANYADVTNTDAKGVAGIVGSSWYGGIVLNCYNAGTIKSSYAGPIGGIVGYNEIRVENCYNIGSVTGVSANYSMAIGSNNGGAPEAFNCYYLAGTAAGGGYYSQGKFDTSGVRTADYMKSDEFVELLGDAYMRDTGYNSGYPVLTFGRTPGGPSSTPDTATTVVDEPVALTDDPTIVVINVDTDGAAVSSITAEVTAENVKAIAENGSAIEVRSDLGNVMLPNAAMVDLADKAEEKIDVKLTKDSADTYTLALTADDKAVAAVDGGVKLTLPAEDADAGTVAVLVHEDGTEEVIKKSVGKDGKLTIPLDGSATVKIVDNAKDFNDVGSGAWYNGAVMFASSHELMGGTGGDRFSPEAPMTRGMLVTVLHRLENEPAATGELFADIASGAYYAEAVTWAAANGIVNGTGGGRFSPDAEITREQLAAMLYRYHPFTIDADADLSAFPDADSVSAWAEDAMKWAVGAGLIQGRGSVLAPQGTATRAEVATILQRFIDQLTINT